MATAMYLEHYLDSLETLPTDLQRNFNLMRDLDGKVQDILRDVDGQTDRYMQRVRKYSKNQRVKHIQNIQSLFCKGKAIADDKVALAMQTYEMVDKHIRRLDADLERFELEIKDRTLSAAKSGAAAASGEGNSSPEHNKKKKRKRGVGSAGDEEEDEIDGPKKKKRKGQKMARSPSPEATISGVPPTAALAMAMTNNPSDVLDMPVDPNEPTYCVCHQVSYGHMIGCDNNDCPIEWFHFGCVGLSSKPKGKWYCPRCTDERKGKK